jgi:hypothetical protein
MARFAVSKPRTLSNTSNADDGAGPSLLSFILVEVCGTRSSQ